MEKSKDLVGFVINYYWRPSYSPSTRAATVLAVQSLLENKNIGQVMLVDGSPISDHVMSKHCEELGIEYVHLGKELTFAQSYNTGINLLKEHYIGLMANDIFPPKDTVSKLLEYLKLSDVGCVFPYLSYSDYLGQNYNFVNKLVTCEPTVMTLNFNIIKRTVLEEVQGIDDEFLGCYNDIILMMKIRSQGHRVVLVGDTRVFHLGKMTISQSSTYAKDKDSHKFAEKYSVYLATHGALGVAHWKWPLSTTKLLSIFWWVVQMTPSTRVRNRLQSLLIKYEAEFCKFPSRFGKKSF